MHGVRQVLSDTDFAFDGLKLVTLSFGDGMAHEQEFSSSALPADVSEPQEPEGWGVTLSTHDYRKSVVKKVPCVTLTDDVRGVNVLWSFYENEPTVIS